MSSGRYDLFCVWRQLSQEQLTDPNGPQVIDGHDPPPPAPGSPSICPSCDWSWDVPTMINQYKSSPLFQSITVAGTGVSCSGSPVSCSGFQR